MDSAKEGHSVALALARAGKHQSSEHSGAKADRRAQWRHGHCVGASEQSQDKVSKGDQGKAGMGPVAHGSSRGVHVCS